MYEGMWKNGKMEGEGIFTWSNGKRYEGNYVNNQKNGFGKFINPPKIYEGFWEDGKPHGKGKITNGEKTHYRIWNKGVIIKKDNESELLSLISEQ